MDNNSKFNVTLVGIGQIISDFLNMTEIVNVNENPLTKQ